MSPYPVASVHRSFFGRHPVLRELRNCVVALAAGLVFLGIVWF